MITSLEQVSESRLTWPETKQRTAGRRSSPFRPHEVATEQRELENEMLRWGVRRFIVSRNNQRIFAGDPAVAVWWLDRKNQLRVLACDKWDSLAANMHALCLTLNAMRGLERWGAYTAEQAAEGARPALPPPAGAGAPDWRKILGSIDGIPRDKQLVLCEHAYRSMSREAAGNEPRQRELNLAIEAARKELGA